MRTILLLGVAAGSLLLAGRAVSAELPMAAAPILSATAGFSDDPRPTLDYGIPASPDVRVYTGYPDRVPSEVDYRRVEGYDAEGRWTGTWTGTYETPDGRRYDGSYEGTVERRAGTDYAPPPASGPVYDGANRNRYGSESRYYGYDSRYDAEMEQRCGRGGTAGGAVVGGVVGGIAGNRIAGRGDRTAGTLVGGALGAIAGGAIGNASDRKRCDDWLASRGNAYQNGYYQSGAYQGGYGYGYYTPGAFVTTTITNGAPVVTETVETSTRTFYENVPVRKRYVAKKKPVARAKPRCAC